jgi:hypothetical protein
LAARAHGPRGRVEEGDRAAERDHAEVLAAPDESQPAGSVVQVRVQ